MQLNQVHHLVHPNQQFMPNGNGFLASPLAKKVARKRKRSTLPSMVINSSPVKQEQERKDNEKKTKERKNEGKDTKARKSLECGKATKEVTRDTQDENTTCPWCNEEYEDLPNEEWIQCSECKKWWHEDHKGLGHFVCDYC